MKRSLVCHLKTHGEAGLPFIAELATKDTSVELIKSLAGSSSTIIQKVEAPDNNSIDLGPVEILTVVTNPLKKRKPNNPLICHECCSEFSNTQNLKMHMLRHLEAKLECDLCGFKAKVLPSIKAHMQNVHIVDKRHQCFYCPYQNTRRDRLEAHQAQHFNPHPFLCAYCGDRRFASKASYENHL
jgi:hypothetical protein